jgi:hypothetical protein
MITVDTTQILSGSPKKKNNMRRKESGTTEAQKKDVVSWWPAGLFAHRQDDTFFSVGAYTKRPNRKACRG